MADQSRIRISLSAGELELEGTDAFVANYEDDIRAMLARLRDQPIRAGAAETKGAGRAANVEGGASLPTEFGEILHSLPKGASGTDQVLVAGYYASQGNADSTFATTEANKLLIEQGIKLSNASQSLKNNLTAKRVFKVGSRYRVSKMGEQHIQTLIPR